MSSGPFDQLERDLADKLLKVNAEIVEDRDEFSSSMGRRLQVGDDEEGQGIQQGLSKSMEVLNSLESLRRAVWGF